MRSKYLDVRKVTLPVISFMMMVSGQANIFANEVNPDMLDDVDLEFVEMDEDAKQQNAEETSEALKLAKKYGIKVKNEIGSNTQSIETSSASYSNASSDFRNSVPQNEKTEVWQKSNFLEMRKALEELTETSVNQSGPKGRLYTTYGSDPFAGDWENNSTKNIDYYWGVGNKYMEAWMKSPGNKQELAKIASLSFKDIKGTEWYASHIATAVYFGVINGYPDGTFKGSAPVSRAEFATMMNNSKRIFEDKEDLINDMDLQGHKNQWYFANALAINIGPMGVSALTVNDMNSGMTRGEVAIVLAREFFSNEYADELNCGNIKSDFKDIKGTCGYYGDSSASEQKTGYMNALKNPSKAPEEVVSALNILKDKGIMGGDQYGNSNWTKTVTRGEVIALMERIAFQIKTN